MLPGGHPATPAQAAAAAAERRAAGQHGPDQSGLTSDQLAELASWRRQHLEAPHQPDVIAAAAAEWRAASQAETPSAFYFPDEMPVKEWLSPSIGLAFKVANVDDGVLAKVAAASSVASTLDTTWTTGSLRELRGSGSLSMATWTKAMAEFIGHLTAELAAELELRLTFGEPELDVDELEQSLLDLVDTALTRPWPAVASAGPAASSSSTASSSSRAEGSGSGEPAAARRAQRIQEELWGCFDEKKPAREWLTPLVCDVFGVHPDAAMLAKLQAQHTAFSQSNGSLLTLPRGGLVQVCRELWDLFVSHECSANLSGEETLQEQQIRHARKESDVERLKQALIERWDAWQTFEDDARSMASGTQPAAFALPDEMLLREWLAPVVCSALGVPDPDVASVQEVIETSGDWLPKGPMPLRLFQNTAYLRNMRHTEGLAEVSELLYNTCEAYIEDEHTPQHTLQHRLERALVKHLDARREPGTLAAADMMDAEAAAAADAAEAAEAEEAVMEGYMDQVFGQNVQQLLQMGFSEDLAEAAMELAGDDVGQAMELCLDADFQEEIAKRSASAAPRRRRRAAAAPAAAPAAAAPPPDRTRLTPSEAVGLEALGAELSWLERYADVQRGVQATLQAKVKQASKERKESTAALEAAQQEARTEREGRRSDRAAEELQRGEMAKADHLRREREVKAAVEREGKALRARLEREAQSRLGDQLAYYYYYYSPTTTTTTTTHVLPYLLTTTSTSEYVLTYLPAISRLEASEGMVATLSAEKKAMEASSDAERRDAKEARRAMAESQRELGGLRQEAAKVRRAAPHPLCPLAPRYPHASLCTLAPCTLHPQPVSRASSPLPPPLVRRLRQHRSSAPRWRSGWRPRSARSRRGGSRPRRRGASWRPRGATRRRRRRGPSARAPPGTRRRRRRRGRRRRRWSWLRCAARRARCRHSRSTRWRSGARRAAPRNPPTHATTHAIYPRHPRTVVCTARTAAHCMHRPTHHCMHTACALRAQELERQVLQSLARVQAAKAAQMERRRQELEVRAAGHGDPLTRRSHPPSSSSAAPVILSSAPQSMQAQRREDDERRRRTRECVVCMEANIQVVFVPCGHIVCCAGCAEQVQSCPSCRANIVQRVRTFLDE